ncbi:MAG: Gfo/Idh/MocA family oxidoreductase [Desulfobacteraceae bacterium]|nr:Gfo/Idh/MocA family oxidoreductase [Desulfobacteraceae bacterium]
MQPHLEMNVLCCLSKSKSNLSPLLKYFKKIPHVRAIISEKLPTDLSKFQVVITEPASEYNPAPKELEQFVRSGGGWLGVVSLLELPISELFGVSSGPIGLESEIRLLFKDINQPMADRLPDAIYLKGRYHPLHVLSDDVTTLLYADWRYQHSPALVYRQVDAGRVACTTLQDFENSELKRIIYRLLRKLSGQPMTVQNLNVGILGYAPSVGELHGSGVNATKGFKLHAICDLNPQRLKMAEHRFPEAKVYSNAKKLANDDDVDLVIIATPPNSHAKLSIQMMENKKHVVCEKPLALSRKETDRMLEMAEKMQVHLCCHQNRRWDPDYKAIKRALHEDLIGDLFYMETFVGGFSHPCGYWHSHEKISGGIAYDWGAHYLDWIVDLIPDPPESVAAFRHKRVWHDVTNADQERIWIKFEGGKEAEFIHSDIAAAPKPKWYLLGTKGAIIGHWKDVVTYHIDPVVYFYQHNIPATEMIPDLTLFRRHASGQILEQKMAIPKRKDYPFYKNLADHLLIGEPLISSLNDSVKVVSILETAALSASKGGTVERFNEF